MGEISRWKDKWVVEMKENLRTDHFPEPWKIMCIFQVPEWIKDMTNSKAYRPWLVSLGPYHHGRPDLKPMEMHKRRAVGKILQRTGKPIEILADKMVEIELRLRGTYNELDHIWSGENRGRFLEMMLVDGLFLLEAMRIRHLLEKKGKLEYEPDDPVFGERNFFSFYIGLRSDVILMENQLPLFLLQQLQGAIDVKIPSNAEINGRMLEFLECKLGRSITSVCLHPLDILHESFCDGSKFNEPSGCEPGRNITSVCHHPIDILCGCLCDGCGSNEPLAEIDGSMPSAVELAVAGIRFRKSSSAHDIDFRHGVLSMPEVKVNFGTEKEFLNLMAFERIYQTAGSYATDFMIFMDNIIDSERDVALLRSAGVIKNLMCSDEEAAKLFNSLNKGALLNPSSPLNKVVQDVNAYCKRPWNKWRANFLQTYMSNPWAFISLVAAAFLLIATFLQTIYTIVPFYTKS